MSKSTSSVFRVDERAWLTMGLVCVVALVILAFRFGTSHPCYPIRIVPTAPSLTVGTPVSLKAETRVGKTFEWNFGDGAATTENDPITLHTYDRAGIYTVVVTVDGGCSEMQIVNIGEAPVVINYNLPPHIKCTDTAYVGVPAVYEDDNSTSSSWAWRFDDAMISSFSKRTSHIWTTPGTKEVKLSINNRNDLTDHRLVVVIDKRPVTITPKPKPTKTDGSDRRPIIKIEDKPVSPVLTTTDTKPVDQPKAPDVVKAPSVSDDKLQAMLYQVADGTMVQEDFGQYFGNKFDIPVMYNGAKTTFAALCNDLKSLKRKKIKSITVSQQKSAETNCIISLDVSVKKHWSLF